MWLCPSCSVANQDSNERCIVCGRYPDQRDGGIYYCTNCGHSYTIDYSNKFCINCGEQLED